MLDTTMLGNTVVEAMNELGDEFSEGVVRSVAIVVEVDDGSKPTLWRVYGDDRKWLQRIHLEMGLGQVDVEADVEACRGMDED